MLDATRLRTSSNWGHLHTEPTLVLTTAKKCHAKGSHTVSNTTATSPWHPCASACWTQAAIESYVKQCSLYFCANNDTTCSAEMPRYLKHHEFAENRALRVIDLPRAQGKGRKLYKSCTSRGIRWRCPLRCNIRRAKHTPGRE